MVALSNPLYTYNVRDLIYTDRLHAFQTERINADPDSSKLYYDLLLPAANMYSEAQFNGVTIDRERLFEVGMDFLIQAKQLETSLQEQAAAKGYVGPDGLINLSSWQQVGTYIRSYLGVDIKDTQKSTLEPINHPWIIDLLKHRRLVKAYAVYCEGTRRQIKYDGRVHPKCLIHGTATGRPSYVDPPVNTLPHARSVGELSKVRSMFVADDEDHILAEFDYAQIELWIMYALSHDPMLLADLTEPWRITGKPDYHSRTCEAIVGGVPCEFDLIHVGHSNPTCPACVKWEFDRDNQKHVNFSIGYGTTAFGLMRPPPIGTGKPKEVCQGYIDAWYQRYIDYWKWQRGIERQLQETGEITTPFGRKRRMPIILNKHQLRQIVNFPIQSIASDYTLTSALELTHAGHFKRLGARLLWTTYDSMLIHGRRDNIDELVATVKHVMERPRLPDWPGVKVDVSTGYNLYEVKS